MARPDEGTALAAFAADVESLVQHATVLEAVLAPLHERHLRGEPVQEDLNAVFQRHGALRRIAHLTLLERLEATLEEAVEADVLEESTRREFDEFWATIDWVAPGYAAYTQEPEGREWTSGDLDLTVSDGQVFVEHSFRWGVDEIHTIRAPADAFVTESVARLKTTVARLCKLREEEAGAVAPQVLEAVCERREHLEEIVSALSELEAELTHDGEPPDEEPADESGDETAGSDLAALFEAGTESADTDDGRELDDDWLIGIH